MTVSMLVAAIAGLVCLLIAFIVLKPQALKFQYGKIVAFFGVFVLPVVILLLSTQEQLDKSKKTEFCLSCHEMDRYGKSLLVDDEEFIPAAHFQNKRIPREYACFSCHTTYTMYGDFSAKMRGLKHLYVHYLGTAADTLKLYSEYSNRECLHCHEGARTFEELDEHKDTETMMAEMKAGTLSCMDSGCHDVIHDVHNQGDVEFVKEMSYE